MKKFKKVIKRFIVAIGVEVIIVRIEINSIIKIKIKIIKKVKPIIKNANKKKTDNLYFKSNKLRKQDYNKKFNRILIITAISIITFNSMKFQQYKNIFL